LRSRESRALFVQQLRELASSRAYWILLLMIGPLVGHAFITAVETYAEASGIGGGPAALAQGLSPLDGIFVPAFGAYDLAITLLFPFVAIRLISGERESGGWKLMLQMRSGIPSILIAKIAALLIGWLIAWIPGSLAIVMWKVYGGAVFTPEISNLILGHWLRMMLATGVAFAAASIAKSASSAAIATLGFTVGTWALEFISQVQGGWIAKIAQFTPTAALRVFEQGEMKLSIVSTMMTVAMAGFAIATIWLNERRRVSARSIVSLVVVAIAGGTLWAESIPKAGWDLSENRRNSFSESEEAALRKIQQPLRVTANLAVEDPRWADLDRNVLSKLDRTLPSMTVEQVAHSRTGLFEGDHYGEVWYEIGGRRAMTRSATEAIVLETIFMLAQVPQPVRDESPYPGHPLAAQPRGATAVYYFAWPLVVAAMALILLRK
jgi:hypothetical protein